MGIKLFGKEYFLTKEESQQHHEAYITKMFPLGEKQKEWEDNLYPIVFEGLGDHVQTIRYCSFVRREMYDKGNANNKESNAYAEWLHTLKSMKVTQDQIDKVEKILEIERLCEKAEDLPETDEVLEILEGKKNFVLKPYEKLDERLWNLGYEVSHFHSSKEAVDHLKDSLKNKTIGFGGSVTLETMGLYDALKENNEVYWHWKAENDEERKELLEKAMNAQIYFSSVNAISANGEIINIDGTGNRIASTLYGHEKIYLVVGINKIAENYEKAVYRARNVAAPLNAKRLSRKTPCVMDLKCHDCSAPERICNGMTVLLRRPKGCAYEIVLIDEELGY